MRHLQAVLFVVVLCYGADRTTSALAQGSGSSRSDAPRATRPPTPSEFHDSFWRYIVKKDAAYNTWSVLKREDSDAIENPHSSFSRTYANKVARDDVVSLPIGSILVREDYDADKNRLSISMMYRVKDYDKDHGNWYWIKYMENGSVARTSSSEGNKTIAGKVTSCIDCHSRAAGKDYVFSNPVPKANGKPSDRPSKGDAPETGVSKGKAD